MLWVRGHVEIVQAVGLVLENKVKSLVTARKERVARGGVIDQKLGRGRGGDDD